MSFEHDNDVVAQTIVLIATIGGIGAFLLGGGILPLIVGACLIGPCLNAFNDGLKRNPYNHGGGGGYRGHRGGHHRGARR